MKKILMTASALALGATAATAGGIERSTQSTAILFENGNYAELNFGGFSPDVSGSRGGFGSGDMAVGYGSYSLAYKHALNEKLDLAVVLDQSVGAKLNYGDASPFYPLTDSTAAIDSNTLTAMLRYKLPQNFSVIGGLRLEQVHGEVNLNPFVPAPINNFVPYTLDTSTETDLGYLVGVAWEKPEIAARIALTYNSEITHDFDTTETVDGGPETHDTFPTTVPESVNLEFQTGVAKDTLLFGSVRWVHWTDFDISPPAYVNSPYYGGAPLVKYDNNVVTYNLGVGRKFNEQWSGAVSLGYEKHEGDQVGNLGPTDGYRSIGLALSYKATEKVKITGGLRYVDIGDAVTRGYLSEFTDNSGWGAGVRVGISF